MHLWDMNPTDASHPRRRLVFLTAIGVIIVLLAGVGVYGLITGPRTTDPATAQLTSNPATATPLASGDDLAAVPGTDDPEEFARAVAAALFTWDTTSGLGPLDYTSVLLEVADPSGEEQAGLAADIAGYLPTRDSWGELRKYATTQHLEITDAYVPEAWAVAEEQAQPGQLRPGTTAYTIEGIRHRAGIWNNAPTTSAHEVAFTVFLTCPPGGDCYLLRLSALDQPLH